MWEIPIFKAEREAGIADIVRTQSSLCYASKAELAEQPAPEVHQKLVASLKAQAALSDFDLHYLKDLMVSTGWNLNDDVFDRAETWAARKTPEHKKFDHEHNEKDIIGHILDCYAIEDGGKAIASDAVVDELPSKFHIITNTVLYKHWSDKDLQDRMNKIIAEIPEGKWYVSMEALFKNFDYALIDAQGEAKIVTRNEETAFLTKHLRAYGGTGKYQDSKIGRLLRNFTFSGKGLVRNPGNPESVIFAKTTAFVVKNENGVQAPVYKTTANHVKETSMTEAELQDKVSKLEASVKVLQEAKDKAEQELKDANVKVIKAQVESLEKSDKAKAEQITKLEGQLTEANKILEDTKKSLADTNTKYVESNDKLNKIQAEQKVVARTSLVKTKLYFDEASASAMVTSLSVLGDEEFTKHVETLAGKVTKPEVRTEEKKPASGNLDTAQAGVTVPVAGAVAEELTELQKAQADILAFYSDEDEGDE